jgi:hypothetical protein
MLEEIGALFTGILFIGVGLWARANPDAFRRRFSTSRSEAHMQEAYAQFVLRFLPPVLVLAGMAGIAISLVAILGL